MAPPSSSPAPSHPQLAKAKRLPLSSSSSQHNKPTSTSRAASSSKGGLAPKAKVVRAVKSNPALTRPAPPSTAHSSASGSTLLPSPSYPPSASDDGGLAALERLLAPPGVAFHKEIFVRDHAREFPHLHEVHKPVAVRRDTPASAISSQAASMGGGTPGATPSDERVEEELVDEDERAAVQPRSRARPLSLVLARQHGGLSASQSSQSSQLSQKEREDAIGTPVSVAERKLGQVVTRGESLDLDRRSSDEISSDCNLDFSWDHPPPRFRSDQEINPPNPASLVPVPQMVPLGRAIQVAPPPAAMQQHALPESPPMLSPSPSYSFALPAKPHLAFSLPPTPDTPSHPFQASSHGPPPVRRPSNASGGHRRGSSIAYTHSPPTEYIPTFDSLHSVPSSLSPEPTMGLPTSASGSTMTSSGSIRVPRRMTSVEMERELFWHPSMDEVAEEDGNVGLGFGYGDGARAGSTSGKGKERERTWDEVPRSGSTGSLVRKSASEGAGLRDRYHHQQQSLERVGSSLHGTAPNTPNSPYGFIHNPTPPSVHLDTASDAGSTRSSWRNWFGGSSRRVSFQGEADAEADVLERGEAAGGRTSLRPGWMRKASLPLPSPSFSFVSSNGSGSSFGNAPGEIWAPSSPSFGGSSSPSSFGPPSPQASYSPSHPSATGSTSDVRLPPQAVTLRRPVVSTAANASLGSSSTQHRGLKPLALTLPPKPLKKKATGLFNANRAPLATIAGSPSKRDLEEGRGAGPSPLGEQDDDEDESDARSSSPTRRDGPQPLAGYELQPVNFTPGSTPVRLRTQSDGPSFALAVHPSTPLRHPEPPSPTHGKRSAAQQHQRTYSTATSSSFYSPTKGSSISLRHGTGGQSSTRNANANTNAPGPALRPRSVVTFDSASTSFVGGVPASESRTSSILHKGTAFETSGGHQQAMLRNTGGMVRPSSVRASLYSIQTVYQKAWNAPKHLLDEVLPAKWIFWIGFVLGPWCWVLGGWGLSSDGCHILTQMQGARTAANDQSGLRWGSARRASLMSDRSSVVGQRSGGWSNWADGANARHSQRWTGDPRTRQTGRSTRKGWMLPVLRSDAPGKWVWRCRVAAILSGCVLIPGLVLAVVFALI